MFTGLVEEKGVVASIVQINSGTAVELTIACNLVHADASIGDSIAINGCCLTVIKIDDKQLSFEAGSETLSRTNLGDFVVGSPVNLERALAVGQRMGGHYVSGHIDTLATVDQRNEDGEWAEFWFCVPPEWTRQMADKGSVAVDGISLTLVEVQADRFSVALIPHTLAETTLGNRNVGDTVNIETDLLAKYVESQLNAAKADAD